MLLRGLLKFCLDKGKMFAPLLAILKQSRARSYDWHAPKVPGGEEAGAVGSHAQLHQVAHARQVAQHRRRAMPHLLAAFAIEHAGRPHKTVLDIDNVMPPPGQSGDAGLVTTGLLEDAIVALHEHQGAFGGLHTVSGSLPRPFELTSSGPLVAARPMSSTMTCEGIKNPLRRVMSLPRRTMYAT